MNANQEADKTIAHQASEWVTVLRRTASAEELTAFAEWIKTSPRHIRDFLLMSAIEQELGNVDPEHRYGAHELSGAFASNVLPLPRIGGASFALDKRKPRRLLYWAAALATISIGAALAVWRPAFMGGWQSYSTAIGEQRAIELADGSIVHLNTRSQIQVRITDRARDIRLIAGEALFKAHGNPARPFRVYTDDAAIQAIGTQFNVYGRPEGTTVAVIEGKVQITATTKNSTPTTSDSMAHATPLDAGESARVAASGKIDKQPAADLSSATAWRQRRLVFQNASIVEMIQEFNRYNRAPQFRLEGDAVRSRHYTGVFDADDPESLTQLLEAEPDLVVARSAESIVVHTR